MRSSRAVGVAVGVLDELETVCRALDFPLLAEQFKSGESGPRLIAEYDELVCADVLQFAVLPQTKASGCSFAELLQCEGRVDSYTGQQLVGEADCFVSYSRQCLFKDFVAAINSHPSIEDQYFWLDMLCLDASRHIFDDTLAGTENIISEVGYTLAVYTQWPDPEAQTQAWCCFELIASALAGNSIEVALPPAETELLNNDLLNGKFDHVITALCSLDGKLEQGSVKEPDDKEQLAGWLLRQTEKRDVMQCAGNAMRSWLARYSRTVLAAVPFSDAERTTFANDIATLEIELGRPAEAEALLGELIGVNQEQLGSHHPSTLAACSYLASLHEMNDELEEAHHCRHRALDGYRKALGDTHPTTQSAIGDMANLLRSCGELSAAEPLYEELCRGKTSPKRLAAMHTLARLKEQLGKTDDAIRIYRDVLNGRRATLGDQHQQTVAVMADSAQLHFARHEYGAAAPLFRAIVSVRRRTLGNKHTATLSAIVDLGRTLEAAGDNDAAVACHREALAGRQETLGEKDASTVASMSCLARMLEAQGARGAAADLWTHVYEAKRSTLGEGHLSTLQAANALKIVQGQ